MLEEDLMRGAEIVCVNNEQTNELIHNHERIMYCDKCKKQTPHRRKLDNNSQYVPIIRDYECSVCREIVQRRARHRRHKSAKPWWR